MDTPDFSDYTYIVPKMPLGKQNTAIVEMPDLPWIVHGVRVGSYVPATIIQEIAGIKDVDITRMQGNKVRQYGPNQRDKTGKDVSGKFVMNDVAAAFLFENPKHAAQWVRNPKQVHIGVAPSLTWVDSEHANGTGQLALVDSCDFIKLLVSHPKMKTLQVETTSAFMQRETGSIAGIERAIQAATAPSLGQQMLQRGSRDAIASGSSREQSSTSVNSEGNQVAERLIERTVLLPNGQGFQIQQAVQQAIIRADSGLGKRKISDDVEKVEIRLRNLQCDKLQVEKEQMEKKFSIDNNQLMIQYQIENDQKKIENDHKKIENRFTTVNSFASTMQMLNPDWRRDKRLVLQAEDYLKNGLFIASSAPQIENGSPGPSESASITISTVAFELGISLKNGQAQSAGVKLARFYKEKYGAKPSKHMQSISGQIMYVNSYTQKDRDLVENAIRETVDAT